MTGDDISALAAAQGGLVVASQLRPLGLNQRQANRFFQREGWTRVRLDAWLRPGRVPGHREVLGAYQLARPQLVVSHWAAAELHDLETHTERRLDFTGPPASRHRVGGGTLHRLPLDPDETTTMAGGLKVTTVARTLADLLRSGPRDEALVAVDSALSRRPSRAPGSRCSRGSLTSLDDVRRSLDRAPVMRGAKVAVEWLLLADPRAGSPAETLARLRMHDAGLHPETQVLLVTPNGRRAYPDFFFRARGLVVEIEGYAWHGSRAQHQRDTVRFNDLSACPEVRRILRFTAADVFHRAYVMIRDIRSALG
ncbi:hypothetical protein [Streptomyces sp. NPDC037389]|uniref:hypothetical protein n=1 Tax=Streptomyces sp. NPDC037389 TaxID=3155369 RepID=UPI0033EFA39A